jgi:isoquinoline 1-oxidoreductase alpha subunit
MLKLTVNGRTHDLDVEPQMPLLWVLRGELNLPATKYGCGIAVCGACTVLVDGEPVRSCALPVSAAVGSKIVTIEGLAEKGLHRIQKAWIEHEVPQCGYCQTGMIMSAAALLAKHPQPTDADIDATLTNLCRCGTYARVRKAIHALAGDSAAPAAKKASVDPEAHIRSLPAEGAQASLGAARREARGEQP